jgi:hypothetical protein
VNPIASRALARVQRLNTAIRDLASRHGAKLVDLEAHPVASDRRLWDVDRLHANPEGHRRIALAAAHALDLEGADDAWTIAFPEPLDPRTRVSHAVWVYRYLTPWLIRRARGISSGDGRVAKRPTLEPVQVTAYR